MLALCRARGATRAPALRAVGRTAAGRAAGPGGGRGGQARVVGPAAGAGRLSGDARRVPALVLGAAGLAMCATCAAADVPAWAEAESARATMFGVERHDHSSKVRLRRANTNLSSLDGVLQGYEYRLRETASFEKIFKYFASVVHKGEMYMTPLDLVRAISPGVSPSPNSKPINIPLFESHESALEFTAQEMPEFFKFGDSGLIPYERFLVIVTLLSLPEAEVPVAYHMCAGTHFKNVRLRSQGLNAANFKFIMSRNIRVGGQGYTGEEDDALMMHLFGEDLKKNLSLEEFQRFHSRLHDEVEKLQYYLLSDRMDAVGEPLMSLTAFARSVAALVPSDYRGEFLERASSLHTKPVAQHVSEYERARVVKLEAAKLMPTGSELGPALRVVMERRGSGQNGALLVRDLNVSLKEYKAWQEALRSLDEMEAAVKRYSYADGRFTPTNIIRAGKAVAGISLTPTMVWAIFSLFDKGSSGELHYDQFVRLLRPKKNINPRTEEEGLGLGGLLACMYGHCANCARNWYDGTIE